MLVMALKDRIFVAQSTDDSSEVGFDIYSALQVDWALTSYSVCIA